MRLRAVFGVSAIAFALLACTSARSSLDSDSDARVSLPPPRYSAEAIGAMFERPTTPAQLLRNLKLAVDKDLIAEPGFFTDANLLKFFGCDDIRREPGETSIKHFALQDAFLTARDAHFPAMTVQVEQGLANTGEFVPGEGSIGHFRGPIGRFGYIHVALKEVPEISAGAIRTIFGTETGLQIGGSWAVDGGLAPESPKGSLLYGTQGELFGSTDDKHLKFVVKRPADYDNLPPSKWDHTMRDNDSIVAIFIYIPAPMTTGGQ